MIHLSRLITLYQIIVLLAAVASWIAPAGAGWRRPLDLLTEPLLRPLRSILPRTGALDLSPLVLLVLLEVLRRLLLTVAY